MNKISVGVDVGKNGYITIHESATNQFKHIPIPKIGKFIDIAALNRIFSGLDVATAFVGQCAVTVHVCIEDVHAIFGAAAKATFEFGFIAGVTESLIIANHLPYTKVAPKKWQSVMWAGVPEQKKLSSTKKTMVRDTKHMSEIAAVRLFPGHDFRRTSNCIKNDDNLIDSMLLCEYCRREING